MNIAELKLKLREAKINPSVYCINCKYPMEALCLEEQGNLWSVYYCERGLKGKAITFSAESEACEYFYNKLINDPTTRMK